MQIITHDKNARLVKSGGTVNSYEVASWNAMIAGCVGGMKDLIGPTPIESEITKFPDFEHLEAKGRAEEKPNDLR